MLVFQGSSLPYGLSALISLCTDVPPPDFFSEGGGTSVHRLCIDRPKNKGVVNQFRQRHSPATWTQMRATVLKPWVMRYTGSLCRYYDDSDKNDKKAKVLIRKSPILKAHYVFFGTFLYLHCTTKT